MIENTFIRPIKDEFELEMIIGWAKNEGWSTSLHDCKPYFAMGKDNYLLLLVNETPVGSISLVRYSDEFSFVGFFIVLKEYRSNGLGKLLWEEMLNRLEQCQTIGLYAVPEQIPRYKKSGFEPSYTNQRFFRNVPELKEDTPLPVARKHQLSISKLCDYDRGIFGHDRRKFLTSMLRMPQTHAFILYRKAGITKKIKGYGVIRPCPEGFRVGPLYADSCEGAQSLFTMLQSKVVPGERIICDIPSTCFSETFAQYFELQRVPESDTIAMFKGQQPIEKQERCYATASLELG